VHFMDITDYPSLDGYPKPKKFPAPTTLTQQELTRKIISKLDPERILATITTLSALQTRYYTTQTGVQAANYLRTQYSSIAAGRNDITVEVYPHSWAQPSVIARIIGRIRPNEIVIIGGHIDSTAGGGGNSRAPGADDDASGSATVLEIFRVLVESGFSPDCTVEFQGYAAEEVGLLGSQDIAQDYLYLGYDVRCQFQIDMDGYTDGSNFATVGIVTDWVDASYTAFLRQLCTEYLGAGSWTNTQCGYACSDHASFTRAGFSAVFAFESTFPNSNPYIHSAQDTVNRLDPQHMQSFATLGVAYITELANS